MDSRCYISWVIFLQWDNIASILVQRGTLHLDKYLILFFISNISKQNDVRTQESVSLLVFSQISWSGCAMSLFLHYEYGN